MLLIRRTSTTADARSRRPPRQNVRPTAPAGGQTDVFRLIDRPPESRPSFYHRGPRPSVIPPATRWSSGAGTAAGVTGDGAHGKFRPLTPLTAWRPVGGVPWRTVVTVRREVVHTASGPQPPVDVTVAEPSARRTRDVRPTTTVPRPPTQSTSTQVN